jgi:hypothetical protein
VSVSVAGMTGVSIVGVETFLSPPNIPPISAPYVL